MYYGFNCPDFSLCQLVLRLLPKNYEGLMYYFDNLFYSVFIIDGNESTFAVGCYCLTFKRNTRVPYEWL